MTINIKGHYIEPVTVTDAFGRRAVQYKNAIVAVLKRFGLTADDVEIEVEAVSSRNAPASATWFMDGHQLHYSYKALPRYVENLYIVYKVIEAEVETVISGKKDINDFIREFSEDDDVEEKRMAARGILGVAHDSLDIGEIDKRFKQLSKKHHPDMAEGDTETFKKINDAHKILRRELQ